MLKIQNFDGYDPFAKIGNIAVSLEYFAIFAPDRESPILRAARVEGACS